MTRSIRAVLRAAHTVAIASLLLASATAQAAQTAPLRIHGATTVLEMGPMLRAAELTPAGAALVRDGNIANLWKDDVAPGAPPPPSAQGERYGALTAPVFLGRADVAGNAETQALRNSVAHPDLRIILTVTEGLYRVVARRSSGIAAARDLKGKRIATMPSTSAAYFLHRVLASAGLTEADVTILPLLATPGADALIAGEVDALAIWEPEVERAHAALGGNAVELKGDGAYREIYSLNTTSAALADPIKRGQIVAYVRALMTACAEGRSNPARTHALLAKTTGYDIRTIAAAWPHHRFPCALPSDLLDVMAEEEQWVAATDRRPARSREALAPLIDASVLAEARGSK